jgi:glutathione reductase (NADPH)
MEPYDVVILGSGTAGQTAAHDLSAADLRVAVVEESDHPGGTCALAGCQPKKWYYEATETVARSRHLQGKGLVAAAQADWSAVLEQKKAFTSGIPSGTVKGLKAAGIDFLAGSASFRDAATLSLDGRPLSARHYLVATGARPMDLPFEGAANLVTSSEFLELGSLPADIVFVGGGFISFEFAHFAARLRPSAGRLVILEVSDRPLGPFDAQMVSLLTDASAAEGIEVRTGVRISGITRHDAGFRVHTASGEHFDADLVVHGAGRSPNIDRLNLEAAGIDYSRRGIAVDTHMRTANPRVFAVGDCAATAQLARVADYEAHAAARNILAAHKGEAPAMAVDYSAVPALLFTYPQYGMVGDTEQALREKGIVYYKSFGRNLRWPTYRRIGLEHAAYKILAGNDGRILGAHILSDSAAGLINTIKGAMLNGTDVEALYWQSIMSPYPSRESDLTYMLAPLFEQMN